MHKRMQHKADTPFVLALDLSANALHLGAWSTENAAVRAHFSDNRPYSGARIIGALQQFLADNELNIADITLLVVASGPGSFTGLRVALGAAESIAFTKNIPIVGVPTMLALAASHGTGKQPIQVQMAASANDVYLQNFAADLSALNQPECLPQSAIEGFDGQIINAATHLLNPLKLAELGWQTFQQTGAPKRVQLQYVKALTYRKIADQGKAA